MPGHSVGLLHFKEGLLTDYFTHFSCLFNLGTPENAARALELYNEAPEKNNEPPLPYGFLASLQTEGGTVIWICDDAGSGDPGSVIEFVLLCAQTFDLRGRWGFEWANTCSKPLLEAFGGGAHVVDLGARKSLCSISTNYWLTTVLDGGNPDA